ncbi:MAG: hypothetical protein WCP57_00240 [Bacteroidota bacterium]
MKKIFFLFIVIGLFHSIQLQAQNTNKVVQLSGIIVTSDSLEAVPYVAIFNKTDKRGVFGREDGFFSLVAREGDSVQFNSVGFKANTYVIPANNDKDKLTIVQLLSRDDEYLDTVFVMPRMSKEEFKNRFVNDHYTDDQIAIAQQNLDKQRMADISDHMAMDGKENSNYFMKQAQQQFYYGKQVPSTITQVNPLAWYKFIQAWRNGDFKKKRNPDDRLD